MSDLHVACWHAAQLHLKLDLAVQKSGICSKTTRVETQNWMQNNMRSAYSQYLGTGVLSWQKPCQGRGTSWCCLQQVSWGHGLLSHRANLGLVSLDVSHKIGGHTAACWACWLPAATFLGTLQGGQSGRHQALSPSSAASPPTVCRTGQAGSELQGAGSQTRGRQGLHPNHGPGTEGQQPDAA